MGKNIILDIGDLGINGEGIAKQEGKVFFVPKALKDETVEARIIREKNNLIFCKLENIIKKSNERIESECSYFSKCGGCNFLNLPYETTLEFKKNLIKDTFKKIAKLDIQVEEIEKSDRFNYRNKMVFEALQKDGKISFGMFEENTHNVIEIDSCLIANDEINKAFKICKNYFENSNFSAYDFIKKEGQIKYLTIRTLNNIPIICVVSSMDISKELLGLLTTIQKSYAKFGLWLNINKFKTSDIYSNDFKFIGGDKNIEDEKFGLRYSINPYSFMQVNDKVAEKLYKDVLLEIDNENVINAYSGAGLLSGIVAKNCSSVIGIEINKSASEDADKLKAKNNIKNLTNICGDCGKVLPKILQSSDKNYTLILDPPKAGVDNKLIDLILKNNIEKIVYIACGLTTLSRDINLLKSKYEIKKIKAFDMFANTCNVETLVVLNKIK